MIGNINHIIDIVAEKNNMDRAMIEKIAKMYYKEWKNRLRTSEEICIPLLGLGKFITSASRLRGFIRTEVKKLRRIRQWKKNNPQRVTDVILAKEKYYTDNIKVAWAQLERIREINLQDKKLREEGKLKSFGIGHPEYKKWKKQKEDERLLETDS